MATLRELRKALNLRQADIADLVKSSISDYSLCETGAMQFDLEQMVILEKNFKQRIDWEESIPIKEKREIIQALISLSENYPLEVVLDGAKRLLKEGTKIGSPGQLLLHYAKVSGVLPDQDTLIPPQ